MLPIAAVVAAEDPEMAAKNMHATIDTIPSPPWQAPRNELARAMSRLDMPPCSMRLPDRIKNGTAMKGKESVAVKRR
ncbi:hypothetical protein CE91St28_20880 [Pyramidobacter piscolens]|nr:hypothetical protein CE91St28_20880 [Pyramidobacter piscolens]